MKMAKIDEKMHKALADYAGPVTLCPPGWARAPAEDALARNAAVEWLKKNRDVRPTTPWTKMLEYDLKTLKRAPRCGARTRAGTACQRPAIRGRKRCRLHGGLSPGAPRGFRNETSRLATRTTDASRSEDGCDLS